MSLGKINNMKGVTLIALTITIVVLAIIAGITVTAVTGEKSTIQEAKDAKASSEEESAKEQVQAAVLGCIKKDGSIDRERLNKKLGTSITSFPAKVTIKGTEIVIKADGTTYLGTETIPYTVSEMVESDKIKVGDYVNYTVAGYSSGWRVLSVNKEDKNVEIISNNSVYNLTLSGKTGYDNLVSNLNDIAKNYIDDKYVSSARTMGTDPSNIDGNTTKDFLGIKNLVMDYVYTSDTNYLRDYNIIKDNTSLQCNTDCWYASRQLIAHKTGTTTDSATLSAYHGSGSEIKTDTLRLYAYSIQDSSLSKGVRPVLTLKGEAGIEEKTGEWYLK